MDPVSAERAAFARVIQQALAGHRVDEVARGATINERALQSWINAEALPPDHQLDKLLDRIDATDSVRSKVQEALQRAKETKPPPSDRAAFARWVVTRQIEPLRSSLDRAREAEDGSTYGHQIDLFDRTLRLCEFVFSPFHTTKPGAAFPYAKLPSARLSSISHALDDSIDPRVGSSLRSANAALADSLDSSLATIDRELRLSAGADEVKDAVSAAREELLDIQSNLLADSVARANRAVENAKQAAGSAASSSLAGDFEAFRSNQQKSSWIWFVVAALAVGVAVAVAFFALKLSPTSFSVTSTVHQALITIPAFALAAYAARESSKHREAALWAGRLAAQLKTVGAYAETLDEAARTDLLSAFGGVVFSGHSSIPLNDLQPIPPDVLKLATSIVEVARSTK